MSAPDRMRRENELLRQLLQAAVRKLNDWWDAKHDDEVDDITKRARALGVEP